MQVTTRPRNVVGSRHITVNTLHKGGDDDDDNNNNGRAMVQAAGRRPLTKENRVQTLTRPCGV
jgi:hypothetical protein